MQPGQHRRPGRLCVGVIEHNPLAARYLRQILGSDPHIEILCPEKFLDAQPPSRTPVSVLVLDRGTLPSSLSHYLRYLRSRCPDRPAIVLDEASSDEALCRLLFLGVQGFVPYAEVENRLSLAIRAVSEGHLWVPASVLEQYARYFNRFARGGRKSEATLTPRQRHIIELVQLRLSNKEVSSALGISESTVKFHLAKIFAKLGVHDRHSIPGAVSSDLGEQRLPGGEAVMARRFYLPAQKA